ncbi:MAG: ECF transporter S component [Candidatus Moranbacteria bacterium]|nr:ECF transporter S component [Candidatus Moranbacteria bacterium]
MKNKVVTQIKSMPLAGWQTSELTWTVGLTLAAIIAPALLAHSPGNQWITGTLVNLTLFAAAYRLPLANAFLVGALPSSIALTRGLLPPPMALMIPYIIFSNIVLITAFKFLKNNVLQGALAASIAKFALLYGASLLLAGSLNSQLLYMFSWPQLATALAGGLAFVGGIKGWKKMNYSNYSD